MLAGRSGMYFCSGEDSVSSNVISACKDAQSQDGSNSGGIRLLWCVQCSMYQSAGLRHALTTIDAFLFALCFFLFLS